jgi:hypothetical protein
MIKNEIIEELKKSELNLKQVWVVCGAAMIIHEIKNETKDIDLGCNSKYFKDLLKKGFSPKVWPDNTRSIQYSRNIEIFENWNVNQIIIFDGIQVSSIDDIISQKEELNREKDILDLEMLAEYKKQKKNCS